MTQSLGLFGGLQFAYLSCAICQQWFHGPWVRRTNMTCFKGRNTRLKRLERLGRGREQICLVCLATLEAFRAVWTLSAQTQHAKSEEEGCRTSDWRCANESVRCVGGSEYCVRIGFLCVSICSVIPWHETSCYVRSGRINCVRLVMHRCMFSM